MRFIYLCLVCFIFLGCSAKKERLPTDLSEKKEFVHDLIYLDQNVSAYIEAVSNERYISTLKRYEKNYFTPWKKEKITTSLDDAQWAYKIFNEKNSYGENLQKLDKSFFEDIYLRSNFKDFGLLNKQAITLKRLNIRAFPTDKPLLRDPSIAGEGFPFDYLQNSSISANKPILVSHYSKEKEWVFIESSFTFGWVKASEIVFIPKKYTQQYIAAQKEFCIKDGVAIYDENENFLFRSQIGMLLPEITEDSKDYIVLTVANYKINQAYYIKSKVSKMSFHHGILKFTRKNISMIINELSKVKYGWGGMYGQRDCSSTLRDFFAPFGIWLPRNSYKQSQVGRVISLKGLSDEEKISLIKEKAIPFETLLYKKGHILLYVGIKDDKIIVFHNVWGVKTKKEKKERRFVIGKPVFSTLKIGSNLKYYDQSASILSSLQSMNIVTQ